MENLYRLEAAHNRPRRIAPGGALVREYDHSPGAFTLLSGWIALTETLSDGRIVILQFALPGDTIPIESVSRGSSRNAIGVGEAIVCSFSRSQHLRLLREDAQYAERYHSAVARELHFAYAHFADMMTGSATERVLKLLWELAVRSLRRRPTQEDRVPAPLSQIQIGMATGITPVHVSRTVRRLREDGVLDFSDHTIVVTNPAEAERLAAIPEDTLAMWL